MLELSSTRAVIERIERAHDVAVAAYTLHGAVLKAVKDAARRGAHVVVELERRPYGRGKRALARENARLARDLSAAGATARLGDRVHAKTINVDGTLYLDGKNWQRDDIVLREDDPVEAHSIAMTKRDALIEEARLLAGATKSGAAIVESESFGAGNATYQALASLALAGAAPRLLVSERDLRGNAHERGALEHLVRDGVTVRVCKDSEKLAVCSNAAWLGSANATYADGKFGMPDWGACTKDAAIVRAVRARLEAEWAMARRFKSRTAPAHFDR